MVDTEEKNVEIFLVGLRKEIREAVSTFAPTTFSNFLRAAGLVDDQTQEANPLSLSSHSHGSGRSLEISFNRSINQVRQVTLFSNKSNKAP